ncbi:hypothetical protein [Sorangium sp. So ce426]|uniref:hypothetical protein n=1 Tax=unclassified Sorangium TaxID=2621164 RepID=UPI003F5C61EE
MGTRGWQKIPWAVVVVLPLLAAPARAGAPEISAGASIGWIEIGDDYRPSVGPQAAISWRFERDFVFTVHDLCTIHQGPQHGGLGVYNQTSLDVGVAWDEGNFSLGPSVALYDMPSCGAALCGRVAGVAIGGHAQVNSYFVGPLGWSTSAHLQWLGGDSPVLPGHVAFVVVAGPVFRWIIE